MILNKDIWMPALTEKLRDAFDNRLLFVGLQGSYRRGEASVESDIDVMVVLDQLHIDDLNTYRKMLAAMPHSELACGFIGGKEELLAWPRYEIFHLLQDTQACYGSLDSLVPPVGRDDIVDSVKNGAASLYHTLCHTYVYDGEPEQPEALKDAYKGAFFLLQQLHYLRTNQYIHTKRALLPLLSGEEREILATGMDWEGFRAQREANPALFFERLLHWASGVLINAPPQ